MLLEPLGLEYIAGALEAEGHFCRIIGFRVDGRAKGMTEVISTGPQVIGVQSAFTCQRSHILGIISELRTHFADVSIILGAHDVSMDPDWLIGSGSSVIVRGDGETTMPKLVRAYQAGDDISMIPGLIINNGNELIDTGPAPIVGNLDNIPLPARHLVRDYADKYCVSFLNPIAMLETSRGCPYNCSFCTVWKFHRGAYRTRPPEMVARDLLNIEAPYVFVTDDSFGLNSDASCAIAEAIKEHDIRKQYVVLLRELNGKYTYTAEIIGGELRLDTEQDHNSDIIDLAWISLDDRSKLDAITAPVLALYFRAGD